MFGIIISMAIMFLIFIMGYGIIVFAIISFLFPTSNENIFAKIGITFTLSLILVVLTFVQNWFFDDITNHILFGAIAGISYASLISKNIFSLGSSGTKTINIVSILFLKFIFYSIIGAGIAVLPFYLLIWVIDIF